MEPPPKDDEPTILRPGNSMQIQIDPNAIFPRPLEDPKDILPTNLGQKRFADPSPNICPSLNGPKRNRQPNPIQARASNLSYILLGNKIRIMIFQNARQIILS